MHYQIVFDAADKGPDIRGLLICLLFVGIGVLLLYSSRIEPPPPAWHGAPSFLRKGIAFFWLGFSALFTAVASVSAIDSSAVRKALREGRTPVVEGRVQQFHPMRYAGHDTERFAVGGVHFAYAESGAISAFSHTSSHGGPIREGLQVRIHYIGDTDHARIVKLEIEEE